MLSFKLASLVLYISFILLTVYQMYRDKEEYKGGECLMEVCMCLFELVAMVSEFISLKVTVFAYVWLLAFTIMDICCHKEDD